MTFVTYQGYEKTAYPQYLDVDNEVTLYASPGASYQVTVCSGDTGLPAIPLGFTAGSGIPQTLLFTSVPGRAVPGLLIPGWAPDPPAPAIPHMEMAVMEPDLSAARGHQWPDLRPREDHGRFRGARKSLSTTDPRKDHEL